ncbi:DUF2971 domain-containing protein [Flavobacterium limi]|uniref:DUF2971 domain-containing protein n=1 Tax=Flavobacterium limi TaxID=2045105 RepID=A0ABQ1UKI0_9FLAO|nr:DUF2971 domain-containing protein [Flavobacterium limi]GGF20319.1 hypothetical protein GCM10011518_31990 [Flavobacterium limi]
MKPESYPEIIYKYRSWADEYHKNILLKGEVYLSAPKNFNDPFDFRIGKNFMLLDSQEKIERYIDQGLEKHKDWLMRKGIDSKEERIFQLKRLENLELYQQEYEMIESEATDNHYGILSLSSRWDSILMWSHYGNFHKGFNVGYNEEKMRQCGLFGKGGPVAYSDDFPTIDPFSDHDMRTSFMQTHFKSKEWEYEQEYRLAKLFYPGIPTDKDRTIVIPFEFIDEINLGISISDKDKIEIVEFAKNKNIKVFQTKKISFKFGLTRFEI